MASSSSFPQGFGAPQSRWPTILETLQQSSPVIQGVLNFAGTFTPSPEVVNSITNLAGALSVVMDKISTRAIEMYTNAQTGFLQFDGSQLGQYIKASVTGESPPYVVLGYLQQAMYLYLLQLAQDKYGADVTYDIILETQDFMIWLSQQEGVKDKARSMIKLNFVEVWGRSAMFGMNAEYAAASNRGATTEEAKDFVEILKQVLTDEDKAEEARQLTDYVNLVNSQEYMLFFVGSMIQQAVDSGGIVTFNPDDLHPNIDSSIFYGLPRNALSFAMKVADDMKKLLNRRLRSIVQDYRYYVINRLPSYDPPHFQTLRGRLLLLSNFLESEMANINNILMSSETPLNPTEAAPADLSDYKQIIANIRQFMDVASRNVDEARRSIQGVGTIVGVPEIIDRGITPNGIVAFDFSKGTEITIADLVTRKSKGAGAGAGRGGRRFGKSRRMKKKRQSGGRRPRYTMRRVKRRRTMRRRFRRRGSMRR
jgi:hypothetical protein